MDGELAQECRMPVQIILNTDPVTIGNWTGGGRPFKGMIDEAFFATVALTEDEIKAIMTQGLGRALGIVAVEPAGKLTTIWGGIKGEH
jgi:hypothetical protein